MNTLRIIRPLLVASGLLSVAPLLSAQSLAPADVNVTVNLTAQCRWSGGTAPGTTTVDFGPYTAFQNTANTGTASGPVTVECTRGFGATPTITWDNGTANGVVAGLLYSLTVTQTQTQAGNPPDALTNTVGTPRVFSFALGGTMPADQPGATGAGTSQLRTLTLQF